MTVPLRAALHTFVSMITFPGSIVHAFTRQLFCRMMGVPVYETVYFAVDDPSKYVKRDVLPPGKTFALICLGWLFDVLLGWLLLAPVSLTMFAFGFPGLFTHSDQWTALPNLLLVWVGFSVLMHSFPSREELQELRGRVLGNKEAPAILRVLAAPFYLVMGIAVWGNVVLLDAFFSVGMMLLLPGVARALFPL